MANYLESIASEWYRYNGYWVHSNVRPSQLGIADSKREFDVIALRPTKELVHVEASSGFFDRSAEARYRGKFECLDDPVLERLFPGVQLPTNRLKVALWEDGPRDITNPDAFDVWLLRDLIATIHQKLPPNYMKQSVPQEFPILRTIQMVRWVNTQTVTSRS
ncbi:MAG: hypothetical protein U0638_06850 [Phycisphaerales bacterium]